jgi:hypothetical protein
MYDVDGKLSFHCDCAKTTRLTTTCLHIHLVRQHSDDFGGPLYVGEEPEIFLISIENKSLIFSVASNSGSARHHSHKCTIVSYSKKEDWKCMSCSKEK